LNTLTPDQLLATQIDRHLAVEAGAGAGKTTVLVERFLTILRANPTLQPANILTITFTKKAAAELYERIHHAIYTLTPTTLEDRIMITRWKQQLSTASIGTISSFCSQLVRRWGHWVGVDPQFRIIEDWEMESRWHQIQSQWIQTALQAQNPHLLALTATMSLSRIQDQWQRLFQKRDYARDRLVIPSEDADPHATDQYSKTVDHLLHCFDAVFTAYRSHLAANAELDFSELQRLAGQLITLVPDACDQLAEEYPFIMIDEFQDTDAQQWGLIDAISGISTSPRCNLFVVGDIKQSIYRFRGSDTTLFQRILDDFSSRADAEVIRLVDNFRSRDPLIQFYNGLFATLFHPNAPTPIEYTPLRSQRSADGHGVEMAISPTRSIELDTVIGWVLSLHSAGIAWDRIAVISRKNNSLSQMATQCKAAHIPYVLLSNQNPLRTAVAIDIVILARFLLEPTHWGHFIDLLGSRWVGGSADQIHQIRARFHDHIRVPLDEINFPTFHPIHSKWLPLMRRQGLIPTLDTILDPSDAWSIIQDILTRSPNFHDGVAQVEHQIEAAKNRTLSQPVTDRVRLMTIHAAKGLEFDYVAFMGCGESLMGAHSASLIIGPNGELGLLPIAGDQNPWRDRVIALSKSATLEEEKRTFYVGCTRAKERLLLSGTYSLDKKPPETPHCFIDFLLPHATILSNEIEFDFPIPTRHTRSIQMRVPMVHVSHQERPAPQEETHVDPIRPPSISRSEDLVFHSVSQVVGWLACVRQYTLHRVRDSFSKPRPIDPVSPADLGVVVHRCLEELLRGRTHCSPQWIQQTSEAVGVPAAAPMALSHVATTQACPAFLHLLSNSPTPEYEFQLRCGTVVISGRIDCVSYQNRWVITDFKTDHIPKTAPIPAHYRTQLMIYALAVSEGKGITDIIDIQVIFTTTGETVTLSCTHEERMSLATQIATLPTQAFTPPDPTTCDACPISQWVVGCRDIE